MLQYQQWLSICLAFLYALGTVGSFTTQYLGNARHPTSTDLCFHEEYNLTIPLGDTIYPTDIESKCFKIYCREDYVLEMKHCDRLPMRRNCIETPYDYSKPYPDCCPLISCNEI